nr:3-keto-5-aminohexanoate cleavage protein [Schumannella luteola]
MQVALNGPRPHPRMPRTPDEIADDAAAAVLAGATSIHLHAFDDDGRETFEARHVAATLRAVRRVAPTVPLNMTTFAEIEPDPRARLRAISEWTELPDLIPVNLGESGVDDIAALLARRGVGLEACLLSVDAAREFAARPSAHPWRRVFVEPVAERVEDALGESLEIERLLAEVGVGLEQVHHGAGPTAWAVLESAVHRGHGIRIGLEDVYRLPSGEVAPGNAELVRAEADVLGGR